MENIKKTRELSEEFGIKKVNSISDLETEIMKIMWTTNEATVREVHELMLKKEMEKKTPLAQKSLWITFLCSVLDMSRACELFNLPSSCLNYVN